MNKDIVNCIKAEKDKETAAIEMLIESKKPREELINLDELEEGIGGDGL